MNVYKQNKKRKTNTPFVSVAIGLSVSVICLICCILIGAFLISSGKIPEGVMGYVTIACWFLASFVGSMISISGDNKWVALIGFGISMLFILCGTNILFYDSSFRRVGECLLPYLSGIGISIILTMVKKKPKSNFKKFKFH